MALHNPPCRIILDCIKQGTIPCSTRIPHHTGILHTWPAQYMLLYVMLLASAEHPNIYKSYANHNLYYSIESSAHISTAELGHPAIPCIAWHFLHACVAFWNSNLHYYKMFIYSYIPSTVSFAARSLCIVCLYLLSGIPNRSALDFACVAIF